MMRIVLLLTSIWLFVTPNSNAELSVRGEGAVSTRPDLFEIRVTVETEPARPDLAWQELSKSVDHLFSAVVGAGGAKDQIEVLNIGLRSRDSLLLGRATIMIGVPVRTDNADLLDAIQRVPTVFVRRTRYVSSNERLLRDEARAIAVRSAVEELDELARAAGGSRGAILSVGKDLKSDSIEVRRDSATSNVRRATSQRVPLSQGMLYFREAVWVESELILEE